MVVIVYDIADNKRLQKVARYMERNGVRVQKSVFEVDKHPKEAKIIFNGLKELIEKEDKCFMFEFNSKEDLRADTDIKRIF